MGARTKKRVAAAVPNTVNICCHGDKRKKQSPDVMGVLLHVNWVIKSSIISVNQSC